jgi:hypothetical protein
MTDVDLRSIFPGASNSFLARNGVGPDPRGTPRRTRQQVDAERALRSVSEADFQAQVVALAEQLGWHVVHINDSRRQRAEHWPDLVLIRDRILYRELKKIGKRPTPGQEAMLARLRAAGGDAEWWDPTHWDVIHQTLA